MSPTSNSSTTKGTKVHKEKQLFFLRVPLCPFMVDGFDKSLRREIKGVFPRTISKLTSTAGKNVENRNASQNDQAA